jgi:apolipoprotein N-acyltransferase
MKFHGVAYNSAWRAVHALLVALSRAAPLLLLALLWLAEDPPTNPLRLMRLFAASCALPALAAWLVEKAHAASIDIDDGSVVIETQGIKAEIPARSIAAIEPWRVPLPRAGLALRLRSGRAFDLVLQVNELRALIDTITTETGAELRGAAGPMFAYAAARYRGRRPRWYTPFLRYALFALAPTLPLFRLHQYIAYGGTFGEYYTYGLKAYLVGFAIYWGNTLVYVVIWAATVRLFAEAIAIGATLAAPMRADALRSVVETVGRIAYYAGVPAFLVARFWQDL